MGASGRRVERSRCQPTSTTGTTKPPRRNSSRTQKKRPASWLA
jgi:hypothetical protein